VTTVQEAVRVMPGLLDSFGDGGGEPSDEAAGLMDRAHKLAEVRASEESYQQESAAEEEAESADVAPESPSEAENLAGSDSAPGRESLPGKEPEITEGEIAGEGDAEVPVETDISYEQQEDSIDPELLRVFFADADKRIESLDGYLHSK